MAKKRKAYLHVGMPGVGDTIEAALVHYREALFELGIDVPVKATRESFRAAVEITREHKAWGFKRGEVEGAWADLCRRARKGRSTVVVSQPLLASAAKEQVALLLDGLAGFEVHVIVTAAGPHPWAVPGEADTDLGVVLDRWGPAIRKPERVHVALVEGADAEELERAAWKAVGKIAGFGTTSLRLDKVGRPAAVRPLPVLLSAPAERVGALRALAHSWVERIEVGGYAVHGDVEAVLGPVTSGREQEQRLPELELALRHALREVERLARRNECLEQELAEADKKRRKLKKKLSQVA